MKNKLRSLLMLSLLWLGAPAFAAWNVADAGAVADATADATVIFQRLLDEAGRAGGGVVEVPAGRYRIASHLSIPANVTLQGIYRVPPTASSTRLDRLTGSVLLAYEGRGSTSGPPFIRLAGNNAAIAGFVIAYPEWKQADVPPVPYPPCIGCNGKENVGVSDCCLLNPYEAIKLVGAARHLVRNITGYPIWRGIYVDECYDIGKIENIHFWPFGVAYQPEDPYCKWINTQGVAFELARTDWHYVLNTFCFGYGIGYKFSQSKQGSANGNFLGLGADSCQRAVVVEQAQPPGLLICNGEFVGRWSSTNSVCLEVSPGVEGKVSLVNCSFWGPIDRCVWMRSAAGQFTADACHFVSWDNRGAGSPAIQLDAGRAIIQGCTFNQEDLQIQVGSSVRSAIITANQATGGLRVDNRAGARTQIGFNEQDSIAWTPSARSHYRLVIGGEGDGRYLRQWHGRENAGRPLRWSTTQSQLSLPVVTNTAYTLKMELSVPKQALAPDAGLYLDGKRVATLDGTGVLQAQLPPSQGEFMRLELRCQGWVPQKVNKGSSDPRMLGVQGFSLEMRAQGAGEALFNANTGEWIGGQAPKL